MTLSRDPDNHPPLAQPGNLSQLRCPGCGLEVFDIPILVSFAAQVAGFPTPRTMLTYIERHHPEWPKLYRTVTDTDGRRRVRRFLFASQCRALVAETFRPTVRRDGRPKQVRAVAARPADAVESNTGAGV